MKKILCLSVILIALPVSAQIVTSKPIYNGLQSLTIKEFETGAVSFLYQNNDYSTLISIVGFYVNSKNEAISLIDKAINILAFKKTDKDQNVEDKIGVLRIVRYGFSQKTVHIYNRENKELSLNIKELEKIKAALKVYTYQYQKP